MLDIIQCNALLWCSNNIERCYRFNFFYLSFKPNLNLCCFSTVGPFGKSPGCSCDFSTRAGAQLWHEPRHPGAGVWLQDDSGPWGLHHDPLHWVSDANGPVQPYEWVINTVLSHWAIIFLNRVKEDGGSALSIPVILGKYSFQFICTGWNWNGGYINLGIFR